MPTELLEYLVCPESGGPLRYDPLTESLVCETSGLSFRIVDGIPNMLIAEAERIESAEA